MTNTGGSAAVTWVLERDVFTEGREPFLRALASSGARTVDWDDAWWRTGQGPELRDGPVVFRGCLGNAARIAEELPWRPGAFCDERAFRCSSWYPRARRWLVHATWALTTVQELVAEPARALDPIGSPARFFARPDSPLKPFSGRVLHRDALSLEALDHGFYYEDASLPVVVAPLCEIGREWRFVVARREVVAGSAYEADGRTASCDDISGGPRQFAQAVAEELEPPEDVFVLDVCEVGPELRLLELNPFSGADLYACDPDRVVERVSRVARELFSASP